MGAGLNKTDQGTLPIASANAMRMTAIQAKTKRKRQDQSVRRPGKRARRAGMLRAPDPIHPNLVVRATADAAWLRKSAKRDTNGRFSETCRQTDRSVWAGFD